MVAANSLPATGAAEFGGAPLSGAIIGDKEIPDPPEAPGYGPARFCLLGFAEKKFPQRLSPKEISIAKIYGVKGSGDFGYLWDYFQQLKAYYAPAVRRQSGMLCYFDVSLHCPA